MKYRKFAQYLFICLVLNIALMACNKKSESVQIDTCDTSNLNFTSNITPILKANCYSCHNAAISDSTGIMNLESYEVVKLYLDNDYHADGIYGSKLMHIILHQGSVPDMPPNYQLSTCDISKIQAWIKRQAPQY